METEAERGTGKTVKRGRGWGRGDISLMPSVTRARAELRRRSRASARFPSWKKTYFFVLEAAWISVRVRNARATRRPRGVGRDAVGRHGTRRSGALRASRLPDGGDLGGSTARVERRHLQLLVRRGSGALGRVPPGMRPVSLRGADAV